MLFEIPPGHRFIRSERHWYLIEDPEPQPANGLHGTRLMVTDADGALILLEIYGEPDTTDKTPAPFTLAAIMRRQHAAAKRALAAQNKAFRLAKLHNRLESSR